MNIEKHWLRFRLGLTVVAILGCIVGLVGGLIAVIGLAIQYWHVTQWILAALGTLFGIYVLGWIVEYTTE